MRRRRVTNKGLALGLSRVDEIAVVASKIGGYHSRRFYELKFACHVNKVS